MSFKNLLVDKKGPIAKITINRPDVLNALNEDTLLELKEAFFDISKDDEVRVVILTGVGRAFVAGADIGELAKKNVVDAWDLSILFQGVLRDIEELQKPVIAAINGFALGGGCELMMACDIIIASERAKFGQPEINLGIIPGAGGTQRLPRLVGRWKAKELIFSGDVIDAEEARKIGLVNRVSPDEQLFEEVMDLATKISKKSPIAIGFAKKAVNASTETDINSGTSLEASLFSACFSTEDHSEGMNAFLEKREPLFEGK
ncbi:MAG: enoyl-CoA hydratase-related protein [Halobacteriota archaeon]|nr:enoyl-CoA hydratase-related protein [Halobacteriota archaeon]